MTDDAKELERQGQVVTGLTFEMMRLMGEAETLKAELARMACRQATVEARLMEIHARGAQIQGEIVKETGVPLPGVTIQ